MSDVTETVTQPVKNAKWTAEEFAKVLADYEAADRDPNSIKVIAEKFGRTMRSIQGKLTTEKDADGNRFYAPPVKVAAVKKDDGPTKGELLKSIADTGAMTSTKGGDGATKPFLTYVLELAEFKAAS